MAVCDDARDLVHKQLEHAYKEIIVAGNVTTAAMRYLEERGAKIEESKEHELFLITLPRTADIQHWNYDERHQVPAWSITFDDAPEEETRHVIVELEILAFESRVYLLTI